MIDTKSKQVLVFSKRHLFEMTRLRQPTMTSKLDKVLSAFRAENYYESIKEANCTLRRTAIISLLACIDCLLQTHRSNRKSDRPIERCIKLAPEDPINYFNKGTILDSIAHFDKAEAATKKRYLAIHTSLSLGIILALLVKN